MEVTDKYGALTVRIQKLTSWGGEGPWKGPFYIRDTALNHWLDLGYMQSSSLPLLEAYEPITLQLRFPPK